MMIMRFFSDFLYKGICCGYTFELHRQVDAIQMRTHNICLYKELKKKYTGCNLKTTEFHECALIGVCAVIRSNTVNIFIWILLFGFTALAEALQMQSLLSGSCI